MVRTMRLVCGACRRGAAVPPDPRGRGRGRHRRHRGRRGGPAARREELPAASLDSRSSSGKPGFAGVGEVPLELSERVKATGLAASGPRAHERQVCYLTMTKRRLSEAELERRLERCARLWAAKARMAEVGFVCEGSLPERRTCCRNPNCRCAHPEGRHGPYWQLTWKEAGHDRHPAAVRGRRPLPRVDRQPSPARSRPGRDARALPPGRRADPRQPWPPLH